MIFVQFINKFGSIQFNIIFSYQFPKEIGKTTSDLYFLPFTVGASHRGISLKTLSIASSTSGVISLLK